MNQKRKALWSIFGMSMLTALLMAGLGIYVGTTSPAGAISSTASAAAQLAVTRPWTAVASTGTVDESAENFYAFGLFPVGGSAAGYKPGSLDIQPLYLRYNVTNTFDNNAAPNMPGWNRLELGSFAPVNSDVRATLYRVRICNGIQEAICAAINQGEGDGCDTCKADTLGPIDFGNFLYYVEVRMSRGNYVAQPRAHTLRLY